MHTSAPKLGGIFFHFFSLKRGLDVWTARSDVRQPALVLLVLASNAREEIFLEALGDLEGLAVVLSEAAVLIDSKRDPRLAHRHGAG